MFLEIVLVGVVVYVCVAQLIEVYFDARERYTTKLLDDLKELSNED